MSKEYTAKSFKSGNSVAIRMPAGLGIEPDREWTAEWVDGELHLRARAEQKKKIDISGFWGKAPGIETPVRRDFDERPSTIAKRNAQQGQ